jgi:uroporphyrinogen decarboxylase
MRNADFTRILKVLRRETPDSPALFEFFLNPRLYRRLVGPDWDTIASCSRPDAHRLAIRAFRAAGYDYATVHAPMSFPGKERARAQTVSLNDGAVITGRASFDRYPWPNPDADDYSSFDAVGDDLRGMKLMVAGPGGVLENVISLVGYDNLCFLVADDPALVYDIFEAVGSRLVTYYRRSVQSRSIGLLMSNDDWGFKTQTMLSPADMRRFVFPWHKRIVEVAHNAGIPAVLHSCGYVGDVMDDIVDDMRYDGKHSFEDVIQPVEEAYACWGSRIAILGGLDVDFILRSTEEEITARASRLVAMGARGGYALGTGNSVPEYIPDEKYFAMTRAVLDPP